MEESPVEKHIEYLRQETKKLLDLLEKPNPGLVTWMLAVARQIDILTADFKVAKYIKERG